MSEQPNVAFCPVCGHTDSLPEPAKGTCANCYNHMIRPDPPSQDSEPMPDVVPIKLDAKAEAAIARLTESLGGFFPPKDC